MNPSELTLLLTRPEQAARRFAARAEAALGPFGAVVVSPVLDIVPIHPFPEIPSGAVLAFTSENAVRVAQPHLGGTARVAWCVGDRTAEAARHAGFRARSAGGDATALAALLLGQPPAGPIVHLSGVHQTGDLVEKLRAGGLAASRTPIYDQKARALSDHAKQVLAGTTPVLVPLFSPRSAALLTDAMDPLPEAPLLVAHLSAAVAEAWGGKAQRAQIAARPDADAMIEVMRSLKDTISDA